MTFLYRSSPLEGGKTISSIESKKRFSYYFFALRNASHLKGIVYLARHIRSDPNLLPADRECLIGYAQSLCTEVSGVDLEDVL